MNREGIAAVARPWIPRRYGNGTNGTQWQSPNTRLFLSYGGDIFAFHLSAGRLSIAWDVSPARAAEGRRRREEKRNAQARQKTPVR